MNKRRYINVVLSLISTFSLIAKCTIANESADALNTNVYYSATANAKNLVTLFLIKFQNTYNSNVLFTIVLVIALFKFYDFNSKYIAKYKTSIVMSVFFAFAYLLGESYSAYGNDSLLFSNGFQIFSFVVNLIGLSILFYNAIAFIQYKIDNEIIVTVGGTIKKNINLKYSAIILIMWLPYLIIYFPGCVPWDTMLQLRQYVGIDTLYNHFPLITTYLIGGAYSFGKLFSSNLGIFFYILLQSFLATYAFGQVCKRLLEWNIPKKMVNIVCCFYGIMPIWGSAICSGMKDYIYFPIFVLYFIEYTKIVINGDATFRQILKYICLSIFIVLFRSEGIYIILFSTLVLTFLLVRKEKKILCIIACLLFFVGNKTYIKVLDDNGLILGFDKRDAYSVIFQCTARYINEYENELTNDEKQIIDNVLIYDEIKENYTYGISDPVKDTYRTPDDNRWNEYMKLWVKMFFKHPKVYIDSVISGVFGYLLPGYNYWYKETYFLYTRNFEGDLNIGFAFSDETRSVLESWVNCWKNGPITSLLFSSGTYTWLMMWSFWNLGRKKKFRLSFGLTPAILVLGICCISPVTGLLRYALPYIAVTPLMLAYSIKATCKSESKTYEEETYYARAK